MDRSATPSFVAPAPESNTAQVLPRIATPPLAECTETTLAACFPGDGERAELVAMLRAMLRIRVFERCLMSLPRPGFQLLSEGEEAVAVGVCAALDAEDQLLSSGRSIGPALARGLTAAAVMAEVLGKTTGPCRGQGGRAHLAQPTAGFFGAHAVVGGNLAVAAGVALAAQLQRRDSIVVCLFGDGACGAGALHETLNIAALWKLPLLLICSNNHYAVSTPVSQALAPMKLADLAQPFGITGQTVDGMDVLAVRQAVRVLAARARKGDGPSFLECLTYRFARHSTSCRESRPAQEIADGRARCPIHSWTRRLRECNLIDEATLTQMQHEVDTEMAAASRSAMEAPDPELPVGLDDVY